jgi:uncharacterized protein (DUF488 family)
MIYQQKIPFPNDAEKDNRADFLSDTSILVLTIGHSTHSMDEFVALLQAHGVKQLVDVRSFPRSRRNPQFNIDLLAGSLKEVGVEYRHMPGLGGFRRPRSDSKNLGWRTEGFRGYADFMATEEFQKNLEELIALAMKQQVVIMCAEAAYLRCHRQLIADALLVRGLRVAHIVSLSRRVPHQLTAWAHVEGTKVTFPANAKPSAQPVPQGRFLYP